MIVAVTINGREHGGEVEPRTLLSDFIRAQGLTGTKVGCEQGVCGACTVQLDGEPVRACLLLAIQADGRSLRTIEGLAPDDGPLHPLQASFHEEHALQCGFCTAGVLMTLDAFLRDVPDPTDEQIRAALAGNLCRCTGYEGMVRAVRKLRPPEGPSTNPGAPGCSPSAAPGGTGDARRADARLRSPAPPGIHGWAAPDGPDLP